MRRRIRLLPRSWTALLLAAVPVAAPVAAADRPLPQLPAPVSDGDFMATDPALVALGRLLFWDPVLSGNRNIACGTCHHPRFGTSDGVSLSMGEGGVGLGPERRADPADLPEQRIPRNAPALFNLGAREFTTLFHDGRIEADPARPNGLRTPLDDEMVQGFSGVLSAQTMFPVLAPDEMAGHYGENEISKAVRSGRLTGPGGAWDLIAARVAAIPAYRDAFTAAVPGIAAGRPIAFTDVSNAIAEFVAAEWRADDSPFDRALRGEAALDPAAARGMALFYGPAGCSACHAGAFQTDHGFHAMGTPQLGPGKTERFERSSRDEGRARVTGRAADFAAFGTPSLRNVTATAPYGHDGSHRDLDAFLRFHLDPVAGLDVYDRSQPILQPLEEKPVWAEMDDADERARVAAAVTVPPRALGEAEIADLLAFLASLTDATALAGRLGVPETVPSGLPVDR